MMSKVFTITVISTLAMFGCQTHDVTLDYYDVQKPMQMGSFTTFLELDTLQHASGTFEIMEEDESYSENDKVSFSNIGSLEVTNSIDSSIVYPLHSNALLFLGNTSVEIEIKHGIRFGALIFGTFASILTGNEIYLGLYTKQSFKQKGIFYAPKTGVLNENN